MEQEKEAGNLFTAVFLAAGRGVRLGNMTIPKPLIEIGGKTLIEHSLDAISMAGIKKAIIVVGHLKEKIQEKLGDFYNGIKINYVENKNYATTDTMHSFHAAKDLIDNDVILLESDLIYDPNLIRQIMNSGKENLLVLAPLSGSGDEVFTSSRDGIRIDELGKQIEKKNIVGEFIGISKLSKEYIQKIFSFFEEEYLSQGRNIYCENLFLLFSKKYEKQFSPFLADGLVWTEVDTPKDLEKAQKEIFPKLRQKMKTKIKRILLLNPPNTMPNDSARRLTTPLGLLYIGAMLEKNGFNVKIIDSPCEGYNNLKSEGRYVTYGLSDSEIIRKVNDFKPDLVGVTSMFSAHQNNALHVCDLIKQADKEIPVVLGGVHPSLCPEESLQSNSVDYVVIGEGEHRMFNLINSLNDGKTEFDFDGIAYKKREELIVNSSIARIENLDELPMPARHLIDIERYIEIGVPFAPFPRKSRVEQIMTSRGCPGKCIFCSSIKLWGRKFRMRSVENVMQEIDELVNKYKIQEIQFSDDNLTVNKNRCMEIFKRMEPYNLVWCTPNGVMIQTLDKELIEAMAKSGCYQLSFALESGSQRVLKEIIEKNVPEKEEVKELIKICHDNNISVHGMLIIGFPGETREEMQETLDYPFGLDLDSASYFIANPLPGSRLYELCREKGYLKKERKIDFKSAEIIIPKDSPDYVMFAEEMEQLVETYTRKFNEYSKNRRPEKWEQKYKQFQEKHRGELDIYGRVT